MSVHGTSGFIEQAQRRGWRQSSGAFTMRTWEGPTSALDTFISTSLPAGFSDLEIDDDTEMAKLSATYQANTTDGISGGEPDATGLVSDDWELDGNDLEKSLWTVPEFADALPTDSGLAALRKEILDFVDGTTSILPTDPDPVLEEIYQRYTLKMATGQEAYFYSQYVLRHTLTVRRNTTLAPVHSNRLKQFTYAQLLAAPESASLDGDNLVAASGLTGLVWLKKTPIVRPTSRNLWEIVQEYWGAESWDSDLYPAADIVP
jgi:hypothetical protein